MSNFRNKRPKILRDPEIIRWIKRDFLYFKKIDEKQWGNDKLRKYFPKQYKSEKNIAQWTTKLGEEIVKALLTNMKKKVSRPQKKVINGTGFRVDWETKDAIWEVKSRNYSTQGTAGEKIHGVLWKYSELPRNYGKPLFIVLVGYQEEEACKKFGLFDENLSPERQNFINMMNMNNMYYIKASDLFNYIELPKYKPL